MKRKGRKGISVLLTLCMVFALLGGLVSPAQAAAATSVTVGGVTLAPFQFTDNGIDVKTVSSDNPLPANGYAYFEEVGGVATLTLSYFYYSTVMGSNNAVIYANGDLTIVLVGGNRFVHIGGTANSYGVYCTGALTIKGDGNLEASGGEASNGNSYGVYGEKDVTISGGTVTAMGSAALNGNSAGVYSENGNITISGGTVNATGGRGYNSYGVYGENGVAISGGTVTAKGGEVVGEFGMSCGVYGENVTISGGTVDADGGVASYGSSYGVFGENVTISGGAVDANGAEATSGASAGVYSSLGNVTISGGTVNANGGTAGGSSYGVFGGGDVTINGSVNAFGGTATTESYGVYGDDKVTFGGRAAVINAGGDMATTESYGVGSNSFSSDNIILGGSGSAIGGTGAFSDTPITARVHIDIMSDDKAATWYALEASAIPATGNATATKAAANATSVSFTLTSAITGTWKVYDGDETSTWTEHGAVSASASGNTLTLAHATNIPAGTYYVSVTEAGKAESERLALTVSNPSSSPSSNRNRNSGTTGPGPGPSSDVPVIVDGVIHNIGTQEVVGDTTTVTVDQGSLAAQIENGAPGSNIIIPISAETNTAAAQLVVQNVEEMAAKQMTLVLRSGGVDFNIPANAIDTDAIVAALGAGQSDLPSGQQGGSLKITNEDDEEWRLNIANVANAEPLMNVSITKTDDKPSIPGATVLMPAIGFEVTATFGDNTVAINNFNRFVARTIEITEGQAQQLALQLERQRLLERRQEREQLWQQQRLEQLVQQERQQEQELQQDPLQQRQEPLVQQEQQQLEQLEQDPLQQRLEQLVQQEQQQLEQLEQDPLQQRQEPLEQQRLEQLTQQEPLTLQQQMEQLWQQLEQLVQQERQQEQELQQEQEQLWQQLGQHLKEQGFGLKQHTTGVVYGADGSVRHVPTVIYEQDGEWFARIKSRTNSTYVLINSEQSFADAEGQWYQDIVAEMAGRRIVSGVGEGRFEGERDITRAEFAAIVVRALGLPEDGAAQFSDVSGDAWYCGAVGQAYEYGIIQGRGDGAFAPQEYITRQDAMLMVQRAAKIAEYPMDMLNARDLAAEFSDLNAVSDYAAEAMAWNLNNDFIVGADGLVRPQDNISRAECATVILRLLQKAGLIDIRTPV